MGLILSINALTRLKEKLDIYGFTAMCGAFSEMLHYI